MGHRVFRDDSGREWQVWDVYPKAPQRPPGIDSRAQAPETPGPPQRDVGDMVAPELRAGWLAFESGEDKRRLAPIPPGWETAWETELQALLARATRRRTPRGPS